MEMSHNDMHLPTQSSQLPTSGAASLAWEDAYILLKRNLGLYQINFQNVFIVIDYTVYKEPLKSFDKSMTQSRLRVSLCGDIA